MTKKLYFPVVVLLIGLLAGGCVVKSDDDPCEGVTCDGHGTCLDVGGEAECTCNAGYINDGPLNCVEEDVGSAIDLSWAFGPGARTCAEAYVEDVHVLMSDGTTDLIDEVVACTEGGVVISPVEDGTYTIELTGLSAADDEWYFYSDADVVVDGGDVDLGTLVLLPLDDGDMRFEWVFGEDELDCAAAGVDRVRVEVYDMQDNLEFEATNPIPYCSDLGAIIEDFELGTWNLVLEGVCEADLSTGYRLDANVIVAHPGENDYETVVLEDLGAGCP